MTDAATSAALDGRVAIVTGAGRGLGRAHASCLASHGAAVIVNDLGSDVHGGGADTSAAREVVDEIVAAGGRAIASGHDIADWEEARALIALAVTSFGRLDVLVNNAGILRDRLLANMGEEDWDLIVRVHLKGHAAPTRHALAYWRDRFKQSGPVDASVIHTSSLSGLLGAFGQANYAAAKAGVVGLSRVAALEGARIGVRSNVISPAARTRLSQAVPDPSDPPWALARGIDQLDPVNVSPLIAWLARADCPASGQVYHIAGDQIWILGAIAVEAHLRTEGRWTMATLDRELRQRLSRPPEIVEFLPG